MKVTRQNALSTNEDGLTKEEVDAQRTDFSYDSASEEMVWDEDKGSMVPKSASDSASDSAPEPQKPTDSLLKDAGYIYKLINGKSPKVSSFLSARLPGGSAIKGVEGQDKGTNYGYNGITEDYVWSEEEGKLVPPTSKGTTGAAPQNPQDGTSETPDRVERLRQLPFARNASSAFLDGMEEPDDESLVSPMYANAERNKARAAFLDPNNKGYQAIRARNEAVGGYEVGGKAYLNDNGTAYQMDGKASDVMFDLTGGINSDDAAQSFLEKYKATKIAKPEASESTPEPAVETPIPVSEQTATTLTPDAPAPSSNGKTNYTVNSSQIPGSNASPAEWKKYFADLDSGKLTRM